MLTKRQKLILDFIGTFIENKGYSPSLEEIKFHFKLRSVATVHEHIETLHEKGYLKKEDNQPRGITLLEKETNTIEIPLLGFIAAGEPIEAIENPEPLIISKQLLSKSGRHYALNVKGNSMIDEGIFDGDTVIVKEQSTANNGETVVAIINENQATLKKIFRDGTRIRLQPANQTLLPLFPKEIEIRGKVISIIRNIKEDVSKPFIESNHLRNEKYTRRKDYSWDFRGAHTKPYTHCLHSYPAMFIPQLARRLLLSYSNEGDIICDIFCGSGTALVEARLLGRNAYGIDLNPFAIFLAKVKTTEINPVLLQRQLFLLLNSIPKIKLSEVRKPNFFNIDYWFKKNVILELARIKKAIYLIKNEGIKDFFLVAFSNTLRKCSNVKSGEFKLVRIPKEKLENHKPEVLNIFKEISKRNIKGMQNYWNDVNKDTWAKPILGNSSNKNGIKKESIDCIITSPPYGDSRTTVAYGQFSRLSLQWLDKTGLNGLQIDKDLLGGNPTADLNHKLNSCYLAEVIDKISIQNENRARDVLSFFIDLEKCLRQAYEILKKNKYFCIVVGNRMVKQIRIPTDFIIAELAENAGFKLMDIFERNIPNKRMPLKNSPTNIVGQLEETMSRESIIILKKV